MGEKFFGLYTPGAKLMTNFSIWESTGPGNAPVKLMLYPTYAQIFSPKTQGFPPIDSITNLQEPSFEVSVISKLKTVDFGYSLIFQSPNKIKFSCGRFKCETKGNTIIILMIESNYFYLKCFKEILMQIMNSSISGNFSIETIIGNYLKQHPVTTATPAPQFKNFDSENPLGTLQMYMFSLIKPVQILQLVAHLICGVPTVITSFSNSQLSISSFGLLSLIYPLEWPHLFIPFVNSTTYANINSPIYIVGVLFKTLLDHQNVTHKPVQVVNIDFFNVTAYDSSVHINQKFSVLERRMEQLLTEELEIYKSSGFYPSYPVQTHLWKFILGLLIISADKLDADLNDANYVENLFTAILEKQNAKYKDKTLEEFIVKSKVVNEFIKAAKNTKDTVYQKMFAQIPLMEPIIKYIKKHAK